MILVGIDDTDMPGTRGTNQLARLIARAVAPRYRCLGIVRHQLCGDPSIPCTSKNGSASLWFEATAEDDRAWLVETIRATMRSDFIPGSDPGLCVAESVSDGVVLFALKAQREVVTQAEARAVARVAGLHLEGLGGTEGGVIGALAAVGLAATGDDGRVVQWNGDDGELDGGRGGRVSVARIRERGVLVRDDAGVDIVEGTVEVRKKLRPNVRGGKIVLTVEPIGDGEWRARKLL
jgi:hypothetical protein